MRGAGLACAVLLAAVPAAAEEFPAPVQAEIDQARADCESFEGGDFSMAAEAVQQIDLTGDFTPDWVVDETHMSCSSLASLYCGTGGCGLSLIVGDIVTERLSKGWMIVDFYQLKAILLDVHGSLCGGINPTPCLEALVWDFGEEHFTTLAPRDD